MEPTAEETDTEREEMAIVLCGACGRRSFKTGAENIAHAEHGPDEPHCPRCGTRLSYEDTKVEHWVKRSEDTGGDPDA